jgi:hypothetical protein
LTFFKPLLEQYMTRTRRCIATAVAVCIGFGGVAPTAQASGLISAEQVAASVGWRTATERRAELLATLERADVAAVLVAHGVSLDQARLRVAALTDAEVTRLAAEIDKAPAGASELIGTLILVFVLLVFTDILGYTRIFPFIKSNR